MNECPCGSSRDFDQCCGPAIEGTTPAATAEALMRSRYAAYVKRAYAYLENSLSVAQRADFSLEQTKQWAEQSQWQGLSIVRTELGGPEDSEGIVEFSAKFQTAGEAHEHHEVARFSREDGRWVYAGTVPIKGETMRREQPKVGRNDPCPCGSGKKYKKCCGVAG
jgi:SEC-C motif-containing protein